MKTASFTHERIAERAYQIYLTNGCRPGHEKDDWLQAQYELLGRPVRMATRFNKHRLPITLSVAVNKGAVIVSRVT